MSTILPDAMKV